MSKRYRVLLVSMMVVAILVGSGAAYYKMTYPYGQSHCCIILMSSALEQYAEEHGGKYPAGQASPEASLSLLYKSTFVDPYTLRGMTIPEKTTRRILEAGGHLGPDSCGWYYVPGLTRADDPRLALLWCKRALGHNGQRTKDGGRQVVFLGGDVKWISGTKWPTFLHDQAELLKHRTASAINGVPLVTALIQLPDGNQIDHVDSFYTLRDDSEEPESSGSGSESGGALSCSGLIWYQAPIQNGSETRILSFSNLVSNPVKVTFAKGVRNMTNVIFMMRKPEPPTEATNSSR